MNDEKPAVIVVLLLRNLAQLVSVLPLFLSDLKRTFNSQEENPNRQEGSFPRNKTSRCMKSPSNLAGSFSLPVSRAGVVSLSHWSIRICEDTLDLDGLAEFLVEM